LSAETGSPKRTCYRYRRLETKKKVTGKAANRGLSSRISGYLGAWEDSNLQPDRYERASGSKKARKS
jgi:hypothetical protein